MSDPVGSLGAVASLGLDVDPGGAALGDRRWFPDLQPAVYLNHAAISPPSLLVRAAIRQVVDAYAARGVGAVMDAVARRDRLRGRLATLLGCGPGDIGLVPNTTHGVITIATCLPWRAGDRVLCFDGEFPTNVIPWQRAAAQHDLRLSMGSLDGFGDGSGDGLSRVEDELKRGLRLVAVSAVQFTTGLRMPLRQLADLCHAHDAELFVDGIQAAGCVPLDLLDDGVDYFSAGSHKWMMGLEGCGVLAVHPDRVPALVPRIAGWLSVEDALGFLFSGRPTLAYDHAVRQRADFVEVGAPNTVGLTALEAGIAPILDLSVYAVSAHVQRLHDAIEDRIQALGLWSLRAREPDARSGILSFRVPLAVDLPRLVDDLGRRGVSAALPNGVLRLSPHWANDIGQADAIVDALRESLAQQGAS